MILIFFELQFLPSVKCVFLMQLQKNKTKHTHTRNLIFFFKVIIQMMTYVLILKCTHNAFQMLQEHVDQSLSLMLGDQRLHRDNLHRQARNQLNYQSRDLCQASTLLSLYRSSSVLSCRRPLCSRLQNDSHFYSLQLKPYFWVQLLYQQSCML